MADDRVLKALRLVRADLKSKEAILDPKDERCLSLKFLVGLDLHHLGRCREAINMLEPLLKYLQGSPFSNITLQTAMCIAGSYNELREYETAYELCIETLARSEELHDHETDARVLLHNMISIALLGLNKPKEALSWSKKQFFGAETIYGAGHSRTFKAMGTMAACYADLKDLQKACDWQEKCVNALRNSLGDNHPDTILAEEHLLDYTAQRRMNFFTRKRVIGLRKTHLEKLSQNFGDRDWRTLMCRAALAQDYIWCDSFKKAVRMQEDWVDVMLQEFGEDDKRTIEAIAELARTRRWMKARRAVYWWLPQNFLK